jgi:hypothetical protein
VPKIAVSDTEEELVGTGSEYMWTGFHAYLEAAGSLCTYEHLPQTEDFPPVRSVGAQVSVKKLADFKMPKDAHTMSGIPDRNYSSRSCRAVSLHHSRHSSRIRPA